MLPGETPEPTPTVAAGTYPAWHPERAYLKDDRVLWDGYAYLALWWTQGDPPDAQSTASEPSPWRMLRPAEVTAGAGPSTDEP
ncbi:carbohydrate-binding protein [Nocardioides anomalus]|uniref:carbohydrate-binding protein n=1 Tax=Nocardioides anomalus TaxID=2712223 RepID=UPI001E459EEF|nr:carbohydrate-binding protein [Nocardioides anomalus]